MMVEPAYTTVDLVSRPDLADEIDKQASTGLPEFMSWESPGNWRWHRLIGRFPSYQLCLLHGDGRLIGAANGVPLRWDERQPIRLGGYDDVLVSVVDGDAGRSATATCLLSVSIVEEFRGRGMAGGLLREVRRLAAARGHRSVLIPLRPTRKPDYPLIPMSHYITWRTSAGQPFDPWLRTHVRAGGEVLGVAERSIVIRQPVVRWERLLGRPMPGPGEYVVPGALAPVRCDGEGFATYAEPNVWIRHAADGIATDREG